MTSNLQIHVCILTCLKQLTEAESNPLADRYGPQSNPLTPPTVLTKHSMILIFPLVNVM